MQLNRLPNDEKNMMKAARKRYIENKSQKEIANDMGLAYSTIRNYFSSDKMEKFEAYFSQQEKEYLKIQVKQAAENAGEASFDLIGRAINHEDAKPKTYLKAAKERRETVKDMLTMMERLGFDIDETTANDKEVEDKVQNRLQEAYEKYNQEEEDDEVVEVEQTE